MALVDEDLRDGAAASPLAHLRAHLGAASIDFLIVETCAVEQLLRAEAKGAEEGRVNLDLGHLTHSRIKDMSEHIGSRRGHNRTAKFHRSGAGRSTRASVTTSTLSAPAR